MSVALAAPNQQSRHWHDRAQRVIISGGQAHRRSYKYTLRDGPEFAIRAKGAHFWDADERQYLDYLMSYGPIILGHADDEVQEAVAQQMRNGTIFSLEHPKVIELAERLCSLIPCAERLTFLVGGSSATTAAIRCARLVTKRERIVRSGYHGWFDWCFPQDPGAPASQADHTIAVSYNDLDALAETFAKQGDQVACFILEAFVGAGPSKAYTDGVRQLCDQYGIIFILDEVKTGFRFGLGGAQQVLGIDPDLATFGKAMSNGFPASVMVGKAAILDQCAETFIGATFHGDLASVAAANVVLDRLGQPGAHDHLYSLGQQLMDGVNDALARANYPLQIVGHPVMPEPQQTPLDHPTRPVHPDDAGKVMTEWCAAMMRRGIFVTGHCWFVSCAHTEADIAATVTAAHEAAIEAMGILEAVRNGTVEALPYVG